MIAMIVMKMCQLVLQHEEEGLEVDGDQEVVGLTLAKLQRPREVEGGGVVRRMTHCIQRWTEWFNNLYHLFFLFILCAYMFLLPTKVKNKQQHLYFIISAFSVLFFSKTVIVRMEMNLFNTFRFWRSQVN